MRRVILIIIFLLLLSSLTGYAAKFIVDTEAASLVAMKYGIEKEKCQEIIKDYMTKVDEKRRSPAAVPIEVFETKVMELADEYGFDAGTVASLLIDYELLVRK